MSEDNSSSVASPTAFQSLPGHDGLSRDLLAAKDAYKHGDARASMLAHGSRVGPGVSVSDEKHGGAGSEFVRSIVFGALDGILTSFGIVASIYGSNMAANVVILLGFSNVIADGIAMGVGDALSAKSENDHVLAERRREAWEYDNYREGEIKEMIELYVSKGFSAEDASRIIRIMAQEKYKDFFIDHMMLQELGHEVPDPDDSPAKAGLAMFVSFILFGSVPLIPYIGFYAGKFHSSGAQFGICCAATVIALFVLGVMQAKFTDMNKLVSGGYMLFVGALTAGAAYLVGWGLNVALGASDTLCV